MLTTSKKFFVQVTSGKSSLELKVGGKEVLALQHPLSKMCYSLIGPELSKGSSWLLVAAYTLPASLDEVVCSAAIVIATAQKRRSSVICALLDPVRLKSRTA